MLRPKEKKISVFGMLVKLVPPFVKAAPLEFVIYSIISICHGVFWGVQTVYQQQFFDAATRMSAGEITFMEVIGSLLMLAAITVLCQVLNGVANYLPDITLQKINGDLTSRIHQKIARLSPTVFEDTKKLDNINKAEQGKQNAAWFVFLFTTIFTFYIPYFLFMGGYLFLLKPILAWSILIVFIPTAATQLVRTKVFAKLEDKSAPVRREYDYYESCIVSRDYFKETRLLGGYCYFKTHFMDTLKLLQKLKYKATMKTNLIELAMRMLTVCGYFGILTMLFDALMKQQISVGSFAAVFNSIGMLYGIMEEVVCNHIGNMARNIGTVRNYLNFLDLEERGGSKMDLTPVSSIKLYNVGFSYPGAEKEAVKRVNLTLKEGETLAVVGENGSGKSTLIRLLAGLYTPTEGSVLYGSTDTREISMPSLFSGTSAVFQKYQRYQMTLAENIGISDTSRKPEPSVLDTVCGMSELDKNEEPFADGYETMLSREFDGVDLSGGQWQRVAIARGFFRDRRLIILDEPTAAIDPLEETKIYNRFAEMAEGKTAIVVTHRLGSVKLADRIVVMKDGEIVQIGTHDELIHVPGEYQRMYSAQEQWYRDVPVTAD